MYRGVRLYLSHHCMPGVWLVVNVGRNIRAWLHAPCCSSLAFLTPYDRRLQTTYLTCLSFLLSLFRFKHIEHQPTAMLGTGVASIDPYRKDWTGQSSNGC